MFFISLEYNKILIKKIISSFEGSWRDNSPLLLIHNKRKHFSLNHSMSQMRHLIEKTTVLRIYFNRLPGLRHPSTPYVFLCVLQNVSRHLRVHHFALFTYTVAYAHQSSHKVVIEELCRRNTWSSSALNIDITWYENE